MTYPVNDARKQLIDDLFELLVWLDGNPAVPIDRYPEVRVTCFPQFLPGVGQSPDEQIAEVDRIAKVTGGEIEDHLGADNRRHYRAVRWVGATVTYEAVVIVPAGVEDVPPLS